MLKAKEKSVVILLQGTEELSVYKILKKEELVSQEQCCKTGHDNAISTDPCPLGGPCPSCRPMSPDATVS